MEPVRIASARPSMGRAPGPRSATADAASTGMVVSPSTALVPTGPSEHPSLRSRRVSAPFLAQLIATKAQLPQVRVKRRAEPDEATAAYGHAAAPRAAAPGCRCAFDA